MEQLVEERYSRHWGLIDVPRLKTTPIKIIGTGSVGSFVCLSLVKMGAQMIEVWDDDLIDEVNISNQFFRMADIGEYKVDALQSLIHSFENISIINNPVQYHGREKKLSGIVITALDSMTPRKRIWEEEIKNNPNIQLYIDPRMGGKVARLYAVHPVSGADIYDKTLYSDEEAAPERCTERTIIYNVLGIASMVCRLVEEHVNNGSEGCNELILDYASYTLMQSQQK